MSDAKTTTSPQDSEKDEVCKSITHSQGKKNSPTIKLSIGHKRKPDEKAQSLSESPLSKATKKEEDVSAGVSLAFTSKVDKEKSETTIKAKKGSVAKAFGDDSSSEEEEMPKEARMRMRNMGRDTPTSAGPNSYNKGKQGFINRNKMWDREMKPRIHLEKPPDTS